MPCLGRFERGDQNDFRHRVIKDRLDPSDKYDDVDIYVRFRFRGEQIRFLPTFLADAAAAGAVMQNKRYFKILGHVQSSRGNVKADNHTQKPKKDKT